MRKGIKALKEKSIPELEKEIRVLRVEIATERLQGKVNPPKDTNLLQKKKKRLARILTILTEKTL